MSTLKLTPGQWQVGENRSTVVAITFTSDAARPVERVITNAKLIAESIPKDDAKLIAETKTMLQILVDVQNTGGSQDIDIDLRIENLLDKLGYER